MRALGLSVAKRPPTRARIASVTDAHHSGPMDGFFATICAAFGLAEAPSVMWAQYRRLTTTQFLT